MLATAINLFFFSRRPFRHLSCYCVKTHWNSFY